MFQSNEIKRITNRHIAKCLDDIAPYTGGNENVVKSVKRYMRFLTQNILETHETTGEQHYDRFRR
jgi:hypothetical protein